eukprot:jgi/Mesvir1/21026/Mv08077-RA.1
MAKKQCLQRLKREMQLFYKDPPPYIPEVYVNESNMLEWHFLIQGPPDTPYEGGWYIGKIKFPPDYPFKPPSLMMVTPTGRFQPSTRLCLSMSDFHPETWNAMWSVATVCVGLLSFMLERTATTGSIETTDAEKQRLARESLAWNVGKPMLVAMFPSLKDKLLQQQQQQDQGASNNNNAPGSNPTSDGSSAPPARDAGKSVGAADGSLAGPQVAAIVADASSPFGALAAAQAASARGDKGQWRAALRVCQQACERSGAAPSHALYAGLGACYLRVGALQQAATVLAEAIGGTGEEMDTGADEGGPFGMANGGSPQGVAGGSGADASSSSEEVEKALARLAEGDEGDVGVIVRGLRASVREAEAHVARGSELMTVGHGRVPGPRPDLSAAEYAAVLARLCPASILLRLLQVAAQLRQGDVDGATQTCAEASSITGTPLADAGPAFGPATGGAAGAGTLWDLEGEMSLEDMLRTVAEVSARVAECGRQKRLGNEAYRKEAWRDALKFYQRALQVEPTCASLHFNRALTLGQLARHDEALAACNEALAQHAGYAKARRKRADLLSLLGNHEEAAAEYQRLVELGAFDSPEARSELEARAGDSKAKAAGAS